MREIDNLDRNTRNISITKILLVLISSTVLIWYIKYLWKRRYLYIHAARLPGPIALPFIGSSLSIIGNTQNIFKSLENLFDTYPGIFRFWAGTKLFYLTADPKYFEKLLNFYKYTLAKDDFYQLMLGKLTGNGLFTSPEIPTWKRHRKLIAPTFNQKILDDFVPVFVEPLGVLSTILRKHIGEPDIDIYGMVSRYQLEVVCETAMGIKIDAQISDHEFVRWTERIMEIVLIRGFNIFYLPDFIFYNSPLGKEFSSMCDKMKEFTEKVIEDKQLARQNNNNLKDNRRKAFLDLLMEATDENNVPFTTKDLLDETLTFIIGGSETSATITCYALMMLGMHPEIQEKVLQEVLDYVGSEKLVESTDLPMLKYTDMVIKETLRLFTIAFVARKVSENIDLGECVIPKGSSLFFSIRKAHTNPAYWPDPFKFDPDRFLPEEIAKRHPYAYIPFFFGARNCIAYRYALTLTKTTVVGLIREFKIMSTCRSVKDIDLKINLVPRPIGGFKLSLALRC